MNSMLRRVPILNSVYVDMVDTLDYRLGYQ